MNEARIGIVAAFLCTASYAANFGADAVGTVPAGWTCGTTGGGQPHWAVAADPQAPSGSTKVLLQDGKGAFPWCVMSSSAITDGFVEVKFKPISGRKDQAGGVVWRWKDGNRYYVARANALENNVSLYYTDKGVRKTLRYVNAPVAANTWHALRVSFNGQRIEVSLDGKRYIEFDDDHITGSGAVGVWTKADSATAFDEFNAAATAR